MNKLFIVTVHGILSILFLLTKQSWKRRRPKPLCLSNVHKN